jgi:hypothetical protein
MNRTAVVSSLVLSMSSLVAVAHADTAVSALSGTIEQRARLPICYGDHPRINTLSRPIEFTR